MTPLLTGVFASQISGHLDTFTPTGSYDAIASYTVGASSVSEIIFSGIPSGYKHLQIRAIARTNRSDYETTFIFRFNGNSSSIYSYHRLIGDGSGSSTSASGGGSGPESYLYAGATGTSTSAFGASIWDILDYNSNTKTKTVRYLGGNDYNGGGRINLGSGGWFSTDPINSIRITTDGGFNFTQYTQFALYGVKG